MSSTLNPVKPIQLNKFSSQVNERSISTPQLNVTLFIDDLYCNNMGTCLQTRIHTWSRGDSSPAEIMSNNYWVGGSCFQLYAVIRLEIDQCISGFLLARGDPAVIGYLNSLKDRLRRIRRRKRIHSLWQFDKLVTNCTKRVHKTVLNMRNIRNGLNEISMGFSWYIKSNANSNIPWIQEFLNIPTV